MYDYLALRIYSTPCDETVTDLLAAFLADIDFESFEPDKNGLTAYIRKDKFDSNLLEQALSDFPISIQYNLSLEEIKGEDWNKEWEQNYFQPILIDNRLLIRSSFHNNFPKAEIEIIIDPKMAFGTGHHATTAGMTKMLMEEDLKGKKVIDMGTGTGILSILAKKLGAKDVTGIDIDEFALENAKENGVLNSVDCKWILGDERALNDLESSDIFLANINLNIITTYLSNYVNKLKNGGKIFLSGFLSSDRDSIIKEAEKNGLKFVEESVENNWLTMSFKK